MDWYWVVAWFSRITALLRALSPWMGFNLLNVDCCCCVSCCVNVEARASPLLHSVSSNSDRPPPVVRPQASISIDILSNSSILELADQPEGWRSGDRVVVASTDYSMHQAEEFTLLPCPTCTSNQIKVQGKVSSDLQYVTMQAWNESVQFLNMFESWLRSVLMSLILLAHIVTHRVLHQTWSSWCRCQWFVIGCWLVWTLCLETNKQVEAWNRDFVSFMPGSVQICIPTNISKGR